jgi:3-methyladenine DNA glycosylase AlkC
LEEFIDHPEPVIEVLKILKEEPAKFVQKSVANHLTDYLKVNPEPTRALIIFDFGDYKVQPLEIYGTLHAYGILFL